MTTTIRNIMAIYRAATKEDHEQGLAWYAEANAIATRIAARHDMPLRIVVGVIAAISPNNKWSRNIKDAENLIATYINGDDARAVKISCYNAMKEKALTILEDMPETDAQVMRILNGQKIRSFYSNIMGLDEVTIDGHARNIAYNERVGLTNNKTNIGKREYKELQALYIRAAKRAGIAPHEMQAVTWTAWRRIHGIA